MAKVWTRPLLCVLTLTFVLSIDYSLSLISIQAYWLNVHGRKSLSGFLFGSYDLIPIVIGPLLGFAVRWSSYKLIFISGLALNAVGNVIYALGTITSSWVPVLCGRLIAGLGASVLPLYMAYTADTVQRANMQEVIGYMKYAAALTRMLGPVLGSVFAHTVAPKHDAKKAELLFNGFTIPGWIAAILAVLDVLLFCAFFSDPKNEPEPSSIPTNPETTQSAPKSESPGSLISTVVKRLSPVWFVQFGSTFVFWAYCGNIFAIATVQYRMIRSADELWKLYLGGIGGFLAAFLIFMFTKRRLSPFVFVMLGLGELLIGLILFANFSAILPSPLYYTAIAILTMGYGFSVPAITATNNLAGMKIGGVHKSFIVSLIITFAAIGRFTGPTAFSAVVSFNDGTNTTQLIQGRYQNVTCDLSESTEAYQIEGCRFKNYTAFLAAMCVVTVICMIISMIFFPKDNPSKQRTKVNRSGPKESESSRL